MPQIQSDELHAARRRLDEREESLSLGLQRRLLRVAEQAFAPNTALRAVPTLRAASDALRNMLGNTDLNESNRGTIEGVIKSIEQANEALGQAYNVHASSRDHDMREESVRHLMGVTGTKGGAG